MKLLALKGTIPAEKTTKTRTTTILDVLLSIL